MRYLSVCSGIEAATVAWHPLGWTPFAFSEIDAFPCAVLEHHYPRVPNLGDMTRFKEWPDATFDVLVGGTPCQSFSVAGLRKGLDDPRGNLMLTYLAIADRYRPEWLVWENVPGVLSSNDGRDFGALLGGLAELGYGFAYRVLDAQFFGVAQRRRRVFVVGHARDWRRAAAVLFERASLRGDPAPRRETGERTSGPIAGCSNGGGANGPGRTADDADSLIAHTVSAEGFDARDDGTGRGTPLVPVGLPDVAWCLQERDAKGADSDTKPGHLIPVAFSCKDHGADAGDLAPTLRSMGHDGSHANAGGQVAIAIPINADALRGEGSAVTPSADAEGRVRLRDPGFGIGDQGDPAGTLAAAGPGAVAFQPRIGRNGRGQPSEVVPALNGADAGETSDMRPCAQIGMQVRRLTPRECERLQGFPDDYTLIHYRGKPAADGPRYKALGNSMAVPVMAWIGERIDQVRAIWPAAARAA